MSRRVGASEASAAATAGSPWSAGCGRPSDHGDRTSCTAHSARLADEPSVDADVQGTAQRETKRRDRKAAAGGAVPATGVLPAGCLALIALNRRPGSSNRGLNSHQTPVPFAELSPHSRSGRREERARAGQEFTIDLRLYTEVLWRHRLLVGVGLAVALALALLSVVRVSSDGLAYRKAETWSNASVLVLSQERFPEGRSALPPNTDANRFPALVDQYAALATSDAVIASLKRQGVLDPGVGEQWRPRSQRPRCRLA